MGEVVLRNKPRKERPCLFARLVVLGALSKHDCHVSVQLRTQLGVLSGPKSDVSLCCSTVMLADMRGREIVASVDPRRWNCGSRSRASPAHESLWAHSVPRHHGTPSRRRLSISARDFLGNYHNNLSTPSSRRHGGTVGMQARTRGTRVQFNRGVREAGRRTTRVKIFTRYFPAHECPLQRWESGDIIDIADGIRPLQQFT